MDKEINKYQNGVIETPSTFSLEGEINDETGVSDLNTNVYHL